jgi:peroxiredoxin
MQLVELQETVATSESAVYALSYDSVEVLSAFAEEKGITYRMLSDVGSIAIRDLGLLNANITGDQEYWGFGYRQDLHEGLPYPGTFVLDERGVIIEKHMDRDYKLRSSGGVLLEELGLSHPRSSPSTASGLGAVLAVWTDEEAYFPQQEGAIRIRLQVEDGLHVYVPPNPDGYINVLVSIDAPAGVLRGKASLPDGHPFQVEGLKEEFTVAEGTIAFDVAFRLVEGTGPAEVAVSVSYQACSDSECLVPATLTAAVTIGERERV